MKNQETSLLQNDLHKILFLLRKARKDIQFINLVIHKTRVDFGYKSLNWG